MILYSICHKYYSPKCGHETHSELFDDLTAAIQFCNAQAKQLTAPGDVIDELNSVLTKPGITISRNNKLIHKFTVNKLTYSVKATNS